MKKNLYIFLVFLFAWSSVLAQNGQKTIIEDLNTPKKGQGNVKVYQDEVIQNSVATYNTAPVEYTSKGETSTNFVKTKGFKIQVFSGNNQKRSRQEAESKQVQVRNIFPEFETNVTYHAPVWRLRVGNFLSRETAQAALVEMKKAFPSFGREMYIVPDTVKRPVE